VHDIKKKKQVSNNLSIHITVHY